MNKERRSELKRAIALINDAQDSLSSAKVIVESVRDEEQESFDNMPEGLQESERGDTMQENVDLLDCIVSELDSINDELEEQIDEIDNVINA